MHYTGPLDWKLVNRRLTALKRFRILVCRQSGWASFAWQAPELDALYPNKPQVEQMQSLRSEINYLIPAVGLALRAANLSTVMVTTSKEVDDNHPVGRIKFKEIKKEEDLLQNLLYLQRSQDAREHEMLIDVLDKGIGYYDGMRKAVMDAFCDPLKWLAIIIRLPVTLLEYANLLDNEQARSMIVKVYAWAIQIITAILLSLAATKLGLSIPWSSLIH